MVRRYQSGERIMVRLSGRYNGAGGLVISAAKKQYAGLPRRYVVRLDEGKTAVLYAHWLQREKE